MRLQFTKMQGAGNDFVVLDATRAPIELSDAQLRRLGDRRFGVGADQILLVEPSQRPGVDFRYRIYNNTGVEVAVLSMGNPHAVQRVDDVAAAPVLELGRWIESHQRFPRKVNAGFMQVRSRSQIALRVFERHAGETLACGTGACAAVAAGI